MKKQYKIIQIKYFQNTGSAWIGVVPPEEIKTTISFHNSLEEAEKEIDKLLKKENYQFCIEIIYSN